LADWDYLAFVSRNTLKSAIGGSFNLKHSLVGLHFQKWLAFDDSVAFFSSPRNQLASFLTHFEGGHDYAERHKQVDVVC
jgi:hypothetical protein